MLTRSVRGAAVLGEGGYQEFPLGPETSWGPVVIALVLGAVLGGAALTWYLRRRRRGSE